MKALLLSFSLLFLVGCGSSVGNDGEISVNSGLKENTLGTLSVQYKDLKETLAKENWKEITIDLDKFYTTSISTVKKSYKIDMSFNSGKITAYADCHKLTAKYKVDNTDISFSHISYIPDPDHAICQSFEDADQALYQFLSNPFEATKIEENKITFKSEDFDAEVILKR